MGVLHELGQAVRVRRGEIGLSQARVAALCGLSRQTINQIETGIVPDLGLNKAERLAAAIGLKLSVGGCHAERGACGVMAPLARAAVTANVNHRTQITEGVLKKILVSGCVPEKYVPHIHALLDDAPVSLLAAVVDQISREKDVDRSLVWNSCRSLAHEVKSRREMWA